MGGLLNQARRFFQGMGSPLPARAQNFSLLCPEGHRVSGARTEGYQALRCPTCGEGLYVLPRSPLPEPDAPASVSREPEVGRTRGSVMPGFPDEDDGPLALQDAPPSSAAQPDDETVDGEIEWLDHEEDAEDAPSPAAAPSKPIVGSPADCAVEEMGSAAAPKARRRAKPVPDQPDSTSPAPARKRRERSGEALVDAGKVVLPVESWGEWRRRWRNPLIFGAVALVVTMTIGYRVWRAGRAALPGIAERGRSEGLAALDAGKFPLAHQLLSAASDAVDALGDEYRGAEAIKQGALEAAAIVGRSPDSLETMLDQASRSDPKDWESTFRSTYKGRTLLLEADIIAVPDGRGEGGYELDYRILPDGEGDRPRGVGVLDIHDFPLFILSRPRVGDRVRFGAELESFGYDDRAEIWRVGLRPGSGVHLTHVKALEALGWPRLDNEAARGVEP